MKVLLFEQWHGGHYFNYLDHLIPPLSRIATEVVVLVNKSAPHVDNYAIKVSKHRDIANVTIHEALTPLNPNLNAYTRIAAARALFSAISKFKPDYTLVPSADAQIMPLSALSRVGCLPRAYREGLETTVHYGYATAPQSLAQKFKKALYDASYASVPVRKLNFVNFLYYERFRREHPLLNRRISLVADPVPKPRFLLSGVEARLALGIPADGQYVGLVGSLDERKAIPELLAAFCRPQVPRHARLLLAGRLAEAYRTLIFDNYDDLVRQQRLILLDRYLTDEELIHGYSAINVATPVYYSFPGLASLALKALSANRLCIVNDFGWCAEVVRRFGCGLVTDISNVNQLAEKIRSALEMSEAFSLSPAAINLLEFHSPDNFAATMLAEIANLVQSRNVLSPVISWDDVAPSPLSD